MKKDVFTPTNILLPEGIDMENWSVIACDQFSSEREYWDRVRERVKNSPSTFNMIIPEAYLDEFDEAQSAQKICTAMDEYSASGFLKEVPDSFVYVERTQADGRVRRGIVGAVDLDEYDFSGKGDAAILASEGTVLDRLPVRINIRRQAPLELPHIMAFIDDECLSVIEPLTKKNLPVLYDFNLMEGGGSVKGMRVVGDNAAGVMSALAALREKNGPLMVMGDGNHSLAAAKVYWDELKQNLTDAERENHPARMALLEINNVYDPAIDFEAIHRVMFGVDPKEFIRSLEGVVQKGNDYRLRWVYGGTTHVTDVAAACIGDMLTAMQIFVDDYAKTSGCGVDYIHGEETVEALAKDEGVLGLILPAMDKSELFKTVAESGVFPKKSFSVGHARDKRYYLECRKIQP
ncbi:MAG: DUF1015 domain-containing protein [Oscillospiraceae bacterium]|nr:DUF1015 domain-containing protein [Oscillospiraceae bacterium]